MTKKPWNLVPCVTEKEILSCDKCQPMEKHRAHLVCVLGMSINDVAQADGVTPGHVREQVRRALAKINRKRHIEKCYR